MKLRLGMIGGVRARLLPPYIVFLDRSDKNGLNFYLKKTMTTIKGPAIFIAQFIGDTAPFNSLESICKWAASLGYKGVQLPTMMHVLSTCKKQPKAKPMPMKSKALLTGGLEITELSTHLQGQLVAVNPVYDSFLTLSRPKLIVITRLKDKNGQCSS
jgi:hypothetical protein